MASATDTYSRHYERDTGKFHWPSIFVVTSNRYDFLSGASASYRRLLIIPIKKEVDAELVKRARERILKGAILAYRNGPQTLSK